MKTAECNIPASYKKINLFIRRFTVYIKQIRFISISGVEPINVLNELFFKLLRMLPLKAIFQSLDGTYFYLISQGISAIYMYMPNRQGSRKDLCSLGLEFRAS